MHVCAAQTTNFSSPYYKIEPDYLSLSDEIAEPRLDMNIEVTTFTVSKKLYYSNIRSKQL